MSKKPVLRPRIFLSVFVVLSATSVIGCIPFTQIGPGRYPETLFELQVLSADESKPISNVTISLTSETRALDIIIQPTSEDGRTSFMLPATGIAGRIQVWYLFGLIPLFEVDKSRYVEFRLTFEKKGFDRKEIGFPEDFEGGYSVVGPRKKEVKLTPTKSPP